ncbi:7914_t:CDS:10 [Paraglomus occultum]|uniref:DIS3-like exonuclease 2 n=1 Tax=Paraglomus occultum TaxID=144539 RepID=A0A9N9GM93_9GLOM|nr:7914_t:CDS:10 [Paraglomus occultum]
MADETAQPDIIANKAPSVFPYSSEAVSTTVSASSQEDQLNRNKKPNRQSYKSQPIVDGKGSKSAGSLTDDAGATFGEFQGTSRATAVKTKDSKDDSENTSGALESLRQMIASIKSMPAPPKSQKTEENPVDVPSKHRRHESSASNTSKRPNPVGNKHKKNASVSFYFPASGSASGSLKSIPDSEDGKPIDIEKSLQDTLSSLRRMSHDKGKAQNKNTESKGKETENDEVPPSERKLEQEVAKPPFDWKRLTNDQSQGSSKKAHRRYQSLGFSLTPAAPTSVSGAVPVALKAAVQSHHRRHSVALNGSKDVLKELEKSQGKSGADNKNGHRRTGSRNVDGNWRTASPLLPFNYSKYATGPKKVQANQQNANNQQQRKSLFAPYLPQASLPQLLKSNELVSGVLRINKRNRSDAYVTTETLDADIYICGSKDRNRALEGDIVAVELLDPEKVWQTKKEKEEKKRKKEESIGIDRKKIDKKKDDVEVEGQGLLLFDDDDIVSDEQRPKYCGHIVAVMERMPGQLFSGTLALLRPSSTATKEREAAEKARREAEDRAAGIEPREVSKDDRKDERTERPKIVWFKPTDKRVPLIAIPTEQAPEGFVENHQSYANKLFVACIKRWPITSLHPFGTLVTQLGDIGDINVETDALLKDNNVISEDFNENVLKCLPTMPWQISEKEIETRRDLRDRRIFTIDPPTSKDLDDAVSCTRLPDGNYEIGVHVADVSYFVKPNTALDRDARKRATTVYLVQKSVPMLPLLLSEEICSLNPVIWKMNPEGKIMETWFGRTIIRSCARLSYDDAQDVIEGKPLNPAVKLYNDHHVTNEIEADIRIFNELSQRLRENRFKRGALTLDSIELTFDIDEQNYPIGCHVKESKDANRLIEEFMLQANMSVAQKISSAFPEQALLRRHAAPIDRKLDEFAAHAFALGYEFDCHSAGAIQRSFDAIEDCDVKQVLKLLAIKPMQKAKYFCTGTLDIAKYHHYALNVPLYTHFTSPIRRYADVIVHRMLEAALAGEKRFYLDKDTVQKTANHCNVKKDAARNATEQSNHLFLCVLFQSMAERTGPVIREAIVIGVKDHAFDVFIPAFGIEKRVHLDQLPLEKFVYKEESGELILQWKPGANSLEPIPDDGSHEEEDVLDVDEEALLDNDDYHYELMDVTSLPIEDEHRLFDNASDVGEDETEDEGVPAEDNPTHSTDKGAVVPESSTSPLTEIAIVETISPVAVTNESLPKRNVTSIPKVPQPPKITHIADPAVPNSQVIRELYYVQVVMMTDRKKSPPVIKVLAVNPYF